MKKGSLGLSVVLLVSVAIGGYYYYLSHRSILTPEIKSQANFAVYYPSAGAAGYSADRSTLKFDQANGSLSFVISGATNSVTFSEQAPLDTALYDKIGSALDQYDSFSTRLGKVVLTHPKNLPSVQVAVLNGSTTLIFAQSKKDVTKDQWLQLFNVLDEVK